MFILLGSIKVFLMKKGDLGDMEGKVEMPFYFWYQRVSFPIHTFFW